MSTYYAAQLGIALSVVDSKASYIREEEESRKTQRQLLVDDSDHEEGSVVGQGTDLRQRRLGTVAS